MTRVWITGASSGIGEGLAVAWAAQGAEVILSGRRRDALEAVADRCPGSSILPFEATDLEALPALVAEVGHVDILVNNAGISQRSLAINTDFDVYRRIMEVDFFAPLRLTQLVLPQMVARGSGHMIAISSLAGKFGSPLRSGYCAAKHALIGYSDALRAEVARHGIRVTVVTPGFVRTEIAAHALKGDDQENGRDVADPVDQGISIEEAAQQIFDGLAAGQREIPVGRAGAPEMMLADVKRQNPDAIFDMMANAAKNL